MQLPRMVMVALRETSVSGSVRTQASPSPDALTQRYRPDVDGLRAVAVLSVFAFHLYPDLCPGGFVGVDVFFVISGFLISRIIMSEVDARRFTFVGFYERRIRRIAPALIGLLIGVSIAAFVLLPPMELIGFANSARAAALSVSNFYFWRHTGYFEPGSNSLPLLHTWSLAVEEQFYLLFPLIFLVGHRLGLTWAKLIAPLLGVSLALALVQTQTDPTQAFYSPATRAWEFLLGSLVVIAPSLKRSVAELLIGAGAILLASSFFLIDDASPFPGWRALMPCLGSAALIWAGVGTRLAGPLRWAPVAFVGRISYSLYLWHWPVIVFARIFWGGVFTVGEAALVALTAFAAAYLSWRFIEEPPRRDRRLFTRRRLFASAGVFAALAVSTTAIIGALNGLPSRYPPAATRFLVDAPWAPPKGCGAEVDQCVIGAAASPSFAVVGDSIALHLAPGFDEAARSRGHAGLYLAKGGCFPLSGVGSPVCRAFVQAAFARIMADPHIETVVLVGRWTTAVEPRRFGRQNSRTPQLAPPAIAAAFARTAATLSGRRLLILTDVPEQPVDPPIDNADRAKLGLPLFDGVDRATFNQRVTRTDALLGRIAPWPRLDAASVLCGAASCSDTFAGHSLYFDDNHPSTFGAYFLAGRGLFDPVFPSRHPPSQRTTQWTGPLPTSAVPGIQPVLATGCKRGTALTRCAGSSDAALTAQPRRRV